MQKLISKFRRRLSRIAKAALGKEVSRPSAVITTPLPINEETLMPRFYRAASELHKALPEYRMKWPQMVWWKDKAFTDYLVLFDDLDGFNSDRRWMVYQLCRLAHRVEGDTAECGVWTGAGSYLICQANIASKLERTHHIFDSFEGVSAPGDMDGTHWTKGDLSCPLERVQENLSEFEKVAYYPGWIPDRFSDISDKKFAFVHIDVDLYEPTRDSIEFFYARLSPGGILLCDDYGFSTCPGATQAFDEFLADKPESAISLSGGGGFIIKGTETAANFL